MNCNGHGKCEKNTNGEGYTCLCNRGFGGKYCNVGEEISYDQCHDGKDNDNDGLIDCKDPDCSRRELTNPCKTFNPKQSRPFDLYLLRPQFVPTSFYERFRFLLADGKLQNIASWQMPKKRMSLLKGRVLMHNDVPVFGINVSISGQPFWGWTLTDSGKGNYNEGGVFHLLVSGGGSLEVKFEHVPPPNEKPVFNAKKIKVMVPWNDVINIGDVYLTLVKNEPKKEELSCKVRHDRRLLHPVIVYSYINSYNGGCKEGCLFPLSNTHKQVIPIHDTPLSLVYVSSNANNFETKLTIKVTDSYVPEDLQEIRLILDVEDWREHGVIEALPHQTFTFYLKRQQTALMIQYSHGNVLAKIAVGYVYRSCPKPQWHHLTSKISTASALTSKIYKWNLNIHHFYSIANNILFKGDGTIIDFTERPHLLVDALKGRKCRRKKKFCRLHSPRSLASDGNGNVYVSDERNIWKINNENEYEIHIDFMRFNPSYLHYIAVDPVTNYLIVSDPRSRAVVKQVTPNPKDSDFSMEKIAGGGGKCIPGQPDECGEGGFSGRSSLQHPKGVAVNKYGEVYIADGSVIRKIDKQQNIHTVVGSIGLPTKLKKFPCNGTVLARNVTLWEPSSIVISPVDNSLHILDGNVVYRLSEDGYLSIVAGRPHHCPPSTKREQYIDIEYAEPYPAFDAILYEARDIAFDYNGQLFILESDGNKINRVRRVSPDGFIKLFVGRVSECDCSKERCSCSEHLGVSALDALLNSPTSITVTPDNTLYISDTGNGKILKVVNQVPKLEENKFNFKSIDSFKVKDIYRIMDSETKEMYVFKDNGHHLLTIDLLTGEVKYKFKVDYRGDLRQVISNGTDHSKFNVTVDRQLYQNRGMECLLVNNKCYKLSKDGSKQLKKFTYPNGQSYQFEFNLEYQLLSKVEPQGELTFFEYNENNHLKSVVGPTGDVVELKQDDSSDLSSYDLYVTGKNSVKWKINDGSISTSLQESNARNIIRRVNDETYAKIYANKLASVVEMTPRHLSSTEQTIQVSYLLFLIW